MPKEGQEAINAFDWVKATEEIGKKHELDEDEINNFQVETLLFLLGITDAEFYAINIENQVEITKAEAASIAGEAFQKIFSPIRDILEKNIKNNLKSKNPSPEQTLNFILSGGDYTVFAAPTRENSPLGEVRPTPPSLADIKANIGSSRTSLATGQEKNI